MQENYYKLILENIGESRKNIPCKKQPLDEQGNTVSLAHIDIACLNRVRMC